MKQEQETVKITTHLGRIITLTISSKNAESLQGSDKFGDSVLIPIKDIKSMYPLRGTRI